MNMQVTFAGAFTTVKELKEVLDEVPVELDDQNVKIEIDYGSSEGWLLSVTITPASIEAIECGNHIPTRDENGNFIIEHKDLIVNLHECTAN